MISKLAKIGQIAREFPQFQESKEQLAKKSRYYEILVDLDNNTTSFSGPYEFKNYEEYHRSFAEAANQRGNFKMLSKKLSAKRALDDILGALDDFNLEITHRIKSLLSNFDRNLLGSTQPSPGDYLVIKVLQNGVKKFLGEYDEIYNAFLQMSDKRLKEGSGEWYCSVCNKNALVVGGIDELKFGTFDKEGFLFKEYLKEEWKVHPVCPSCRRDVLDGFYFITNNMRYWLYRGLSYYIIPHLHVGDNSLYREILGIFFSSSPENEEVHPLISSERDILYYLSKQNDVLSIDILFLSENQSAMVIVDRISDVYPSRLRVLYDAKEKAEKSMQEEFRRRITIRLSDFQRLFDYKGKDALEKYKPTIISLIRKTFVGEPIPFDYFMSIVSEAVDFKVGKWKSKAIPKEFLEEDIFRYLALILFLDNLNLLQKNKEEVSNMISDIQKIVLEAIEPYVTNDRERFMLLLGAVTAKFGDEQKKEHNLPPDAVPPILKSLRIVDYNYALNILFPSIAQKYNYLSYKGPALRIALEILSSLALPGPSKDRDRENALFWIGTCMKNYIFSKIFESNK